jgi:glucosyl-dolichyl phosphate glucuronosyltransferase
MISVIVCTYNRSNSLSVALDSLTRMHVPRGLAWELVIVDNNSRDGTEEVVKQYQRTAPFEVRYVFESKQGHSHARNRGVEESKGHVLAFTDDDVTVDAHWLEELRQTYDRFDCLGIGGRIVPLWMCAKPAWLEESGPYALMKAIVSFDHGDEAFLLTTPPFGANMSFRRDAFLRYGLFCTDLGRIGTRLRGAEDTEFGTRLLRKNERLIYSPGVIIYHPVDRERATQSYFQQWYFQYGRTAARAARAPVVRGRVRPRARLLRSLVANLVKWATARDQRRRCYYRLHVCENLGRIREACAFTRTADDSVIPRLSNPTATSIRSPNE